jgi:hypothetical protein
MRGMVQQLTHVLLVARLRVVVGSIKRRTEQGIKLRPVLKLLPSRGCVVMQVPMSSHAATHVVDLQYQCLAQELVAS